MRVGSTLFVIVASVLGLGTMALAPMSGSSTTLYMLEDRSDFETGCFGPCDCLTRFEPLRGTFELKRLNPDPLFDNYEVAGVAWDVPRQDSVLHITGSGRYRIGGEVAVQQQLTLDLAVGGQPVQHFDSGVVIAGGPFPKIDVVISLHDMQACTDTVLHVQASPSGPTGLRRSSWGAVKARYR